jgi:alpha-galactosidase
MKSKTSLALLLTVTVLPFVPAVLGGTALGRTPQMGWNSWNSFKAAVNYTVVQEVLDLFDSLGLKKVGYEYISLDDGWASYNRTIDGYLQVNLTSFPRGIEALANEVHTHGLKLGLYGDSGHYTCAWRPGSWGFEERDAQTFANWGVDYLKYDNCGGFQSMTEAPQVRFGAMKNALALSGRDIFYSVCEWGYQFPWHWGGGKLTVENPVTSCILIQISLFSQILAIPIECRVILRQASPTKPPVNARLPTVSIQDMLVVLS